VLALSAPEQNVRVKSEQLSSEVAASNSIGNVLSFSAQMVERWIDAHWRLYLILSSALCFATFSGYSWRKFPWIDEVLQIAIERLPTGRQVWDALKDGMIQVDPPVQHLGVHYLFQIFGEHVFLARLPAIAGFCVTCAALAMLVRRHASPLFAAAAFFAPYASVLRSRAMDARPYGMMFGCSALVWLCWDGVASGRRRVFWRVAFTLSLAAMFSTHFYSILLMLPLAMGEATLWLQRKKVDWATVSCVAIAAIPYAVWLPILLSASRKYLSHYFYPVSFSNLYNFFEFAVASLPYAAALIFLALAGAAGAKLQDQPTSAPNERERALLAVVAGFLLIPLGGFLGGVFVTKNFVPYYHVIAAFGVVVGVPLILSLCTGRNSTAGLCLFLALSVHGLFVTTRGLSGFLRGTEVPYPKEAELRRLTGEDRPDIVVPSPMHFLVFKEANRQDPVDSLVYLYDPKKALKELGTDTADILHEHLGKITDARIEPFDTYVAQHHKFYIAVLGEVKGVQEWQFSYLQKEMHANLWWLGKSGDFDLFRVELAAAAER
jgi:hypothetical protein